MMAEAFTGTVRWWREEKGYGRINGDDGYVYFCHFAALVDPAAAGYRRLEQGQRVAFEWHEGNVAAHGRKAASNVGLV